MSNGYHEGLACEHEFLIGPPCGSRARWVATDGRARCDRHFEDWLSGYGWPRREAMRAEARRLP